MNTYWRRVAAAVTVIVAVAAACIGQVVLG